jgi:hypothetical protein
MGIGCGSRQVWWWILPCWQCRQDLAQLVMLLESSRQINLEDTGPREERLPAWEMLCKCKKKMSSLNFAGTMGWKTPIETSRTRRRAPACRNAILRDEPLSKRCVSAQRFCSAAMASKSTGSATDVAATVPDGFGEGVSRTKNRQHHFSNWADLTSAH